MAKRNPKSRSLDRAKHISENQIEIKVVISLEAFECMKLAEDLAAQKASKSPTRGEVLGAVYLEHVKRHDPVEKAKRWMARKKRRRIYGWEQERQGKCQETSPCPSRVSKAGRIRIQANERHEVNLRDEGRCTWVDENGVRCNSRRWTEYHHIQMVSDGGGRK